MPINITMSLDEDFVRDASEEDAATIGQAVLVMAREKLSERAA